MKKNILNMVRKAISVGTGGNVTDFLPAPLAAEVIAFIREINILRRRLRVFKQVARNWKKPKVATGAAAFHVPDGVSVAATNFTSSSVTWEAKKLMSFITVDEEAIEDSQPSVLAITNMQMAEAIAEAEENAMLNGDPDHLATAPSVGGDVNWFAQDPRIALKGIFVASGEVAAADNVDGGGGTFDKEMVNTALFNLGKFGRNKSKIIGLLPSEQASNVRSNSDFHDASATGLALAFFINGAGSAGEGEGLVTTIYGVRMFETPQVNTFDHGGKVAIFMESSPEIGDRRLIKIATDEIIEADQRKFVMSERISFNYNYQEALTQINNLSTTIAS